MRRARRIAALTAAGAVIAVGAVACTPPANPPIDTPGTIANVVPFAGTPNFTGPPPPPGGFGTQVTSVAQVGSLMVAGGNFTRSTAQPGRSWLPGPARPARSTPRFLRPDRHPTVRSMPSSRPGPHRLLRGGPLHHVRRHRHERRPLRDRDTAPGSTTFRPVIADGTINTMQLVGSTCCSAGTSAASNGVARQGLASVNSATGARSSPSSTSISTDHHNFTRQPGRSARSARSAWRSPPTARA